MGIVMYVFDERWTDKSFDRANHGDKTVRFIIVKPDMYIQEIVARTLAAKLPGEKFELLRLCGHGNNGILFLGLALQSPLSTFLAPWRPHFDELQKKIELHGCGIASDSDVLRPGADPVSPNPTDIVPGTFSGKRDRVGFGGQGYTFLLSVAVTTMAPVEAAVNAQYPNKIFRFQGPTITVNPDGSWVQANSALKGIGNPMAPDPD